MLDHPIPPSTIFLSSQCPLWGKIIYPRGQISICQLVHLICLTRSHFVISPGNIAEHNRGVRASGRQAGREAQVYPTRSSSSPLYLRLSQKYEHKKILRTTKRLIEGNKMWSCRHQIIHQCHIRHSYITNYNHAQQNNRKRSESERIFKLLWFFKDFFLALLLSLITKKR